ncbi:MAG: RNHCP domain-containing protein [Gammaproteobacteria bacterium]|nr:RNHCP domain-containing protein [Gammaproteobacteria bacterium]
MDEKIPKKHPFQRNNFIVLDHEDYVCEHCHKPVQGGRYNNHCPHCLWSKHLDQDVPGDRSSSCQSLMKPIGVTRKNGKWRIIHQCLKCHKQTETYTASDDDFDKIIQLSLKTN